MTVQEYNKYYNASHKAERAAARKEKAENDPYYLAGKRIRRYRQSDRQYNRGECTLTPEDLVEKIWKKGCCYCGTTDWHVLGVDRIYNYLPHRPDNVVCSCKRCNELRQKREFEEYFFERFIDKIQNEEDS